MTDPTEQLPLEEIEIFGDDKSLGFDVPPLDEITTLPDIMDFFGELDPTQLQNDDYYDFSTVPDGDYKIAGELITSSTYRKEYTGLVHLRVFTTKNGSEVFDELVSGYVSIGEKAVLINGGEEAISLASFKYLCTPPATSESEDVFEL